MVVQVADGVIPDDLEIGQMRDLIHPAANAVGHHGLFALRGRAIELADENESCDCHAGDDKEGDHHDRPEQISLACRSAHTQQPRGLGAS